MLYTKSMTTVLIGGPLVAFFSFLCVFMWIRDLGLRRFLFLVFCVFFWYIAIPVWLLSGNGESGDERITRLRKECEKGPGNTDFQREDLERKYRRLAKLEASAGL